MGEQQHTLAHRLRECVERARTARQDGDHATYRRLIEEFIFLGHACAASLGHDPIPPAPRILPRILVLSDHALTVKLMRECLITHAYAANLELVEHRSLECVLDRVTEEMPYLILVTTPLTLDRGLGALHRIRGHARGRRLPIIVLGDCNPGHEAILAIAAGASDYLTMPNSIEAYGPLIERMRSHIMDSVASEVRTSSTVL